MKSIIICGILILIGMAIIVNRPFVFSKVDPIILADDPVIGSFVFRANADGSNREPQNCYLNAKSVKNYLIKNMKYSEENLMRAYIQTLAAWYQAGIVNLYGEDPITTPHSLMMLNGECGKTAEGIKAKANIAFLENEMKLIAPKLRYHWNCSLDKYNASPVTQLMKADGNPNLHGIVYYEIMFTAWGWLDVSTRKMKPPLCHRFLRFF